MQLRPVTLHGHSVGVAGALRWTGSTSCGAWQHCEQACDRAGVACSRAAWIFDSMPQRTGHAANCVASSRWIADLSIDNRAVEHPSNYLLDYRRRDPQRQGGVPAPVVGVNAALAQCRLGLALPSNTQHLSGCQIRLASMRYSPGDFATDLGIRPVRTLAANDPGHHSHGGSLHAPANLQPLDLGLPGQDAGHVAIYDFHGKTRLHRRFFRCRAVQPMPSGHCMGCGQNIQGKRDRGWPRSFFRRWPATWFGSFGKRPG